MPPLACAFFLIHIEKEPLHPLPPDIHSQNKSKITEPLFNICTGAKTFLDVCHVLPPKYTSSTASALLLTRSHHAGP
jgi:hypothetical protein